MKILMAVFVAISLIGATFAEDKPAPPAAPDSEMADRIAAAKARMDAKKAAAAQGVLSNDPAVLRAIILDQRQQIDSLSAQLATLAQEIATLKKGSHAIAAPGKAQSNDEKVIVLSAKDYASLDKTRPNSDFPNHVNAVCRAGAPGGMWKVLAVVDESTAVLEVSWAGADGQAIPTSMMKMMIEGASTEGQADDHFWQGPGPSWFKIVGTRQYNGTTYFVAHPIIQTDKAHPLSQVPAK